MKRLCSCNVHVIKDGCNGQGVVHITGGGFPENIPRVVPKDKDLGFSIDRSSWEVPPLFQWLQSVCTRSLFPRASCFTVGFIMDPETLEPL